jgi:hypothetical protein
MRTYLFLLAFAWLIAPGHAQQQSPPDPIILQKALAAVVKQRNDANNKAADMEAMWSQQLDENAKLRAELEELKKKTPPPK